MTQETNLYMPTKYVYSEMSHAIGMTGVIEYWETEGPAGQICIPLSLLYTGVG